MPTFSYREKNVTISVRCGARCRAYHASSMGEGKGAPHNCAPARFLFFGFFNSMESAFPYEESFSVRPNPVRRRLSWRRPPRKALTLRRATPNWPGFSRSAGAFVGVALPAKPYSFVRKHHAYRLGPVRRRLCWRRPPRKALTLRRATPTWPGRASGNPGCPFPIRRECDEHI